MTLLPETSKNEGTGHMPIAQVQKLIIKALRSNLELSLSDLVAKVRPNVGSGRNEVKAAVVPLLYLKRVTLTPTRKFRIGDDR